jgi:hypothetical protein
LTVIQAESAITSSSVTSGVIAHAALAGPRDRLCWTRNPSKWATLPLSISIGTSTISARFGRLSVSDQRASGPR